MDTRKMTLFATIAAIALLAVGIGYAYTASTTNSGNLVNTEYVTLTQDSAGAYSFAADAADVKVEWNTDDGWNENGTAYGVYGDSTKKVKTKYTIANADDEILTGFNLVPIGSSFNLVASKNGGTEAITVQMTAANFNYEETGAVLFVKVGSEFFKLTANNTFNKANGQGQYDAGNQFTIAYGQGSYPATAVTVYYGYAGDALFVEHNVGTEPVGPGAYPVGGQGPVYGTLTFETVTPTP